MSIPLTRRRPPEGFCTQKDAKERTPRLRAGRCGRGGETMEERWVPPASTDQLLTRLCITLKTWPEGGRQLRGGNGGGWEGGRRGVGGWTMDYYYFVLWSYATVRPPTPTPTPGGGGSEPPPPGWERPQRGETPASHSILHMPPLLLSSRWVGPPLPCRRRCARSRPRTHTSNYLSTPTAHFEQISSPAQASLRPGCRRDPARLRVEWRLHPRTEANGTRRGFEKKEREKKKKADGEDASGDSNTSST